MANAPSQAYVPTLWNAKLRDRYRDSVVFAQAFATTYQNQLREAGQAIQLSELKLPGNRKRSYGEELRVDHVGSAKQTLVVDQNDYFNIIVEDIEKVQANADIWNRMARDKADDLAIDFDRYLYFTLFGGAGTDLGTVELGGTDEDAAFKLLGKLRGTLGRTTKGNAGTPIGFVPPEFIGECVNSRRFAYSSKTDSSLLTGEFGILNGVRLVETNTTLDYQRDAQGNLVLDGDDLPIALGTAGIVVVKGDEAGERVTQLYMEGETIRSERFPGSLLRGWHYYGAKVLRPEAAVTATINLEDTNVGAVTRVPDNYELVTPVGSHKNSAFQDGVDRPGTATESESDLLD